MKDLFRARGRLVLVSADELVLFVFICVLCHIDLVVISSHFILQYCYIKICNILTDMLWYVLCAAIMRPMFLSTSAIFIPSPRVYAEKDLNMYTESVSDMNVGSNYDVSAGGTLLSPHLYLVDDYLYRCSTCLDARPF